MLSDLKTGFNPLRQFKGVFSMGVRSCVSSSGFVYGIHKPRFEVSNFREKDLTGSLGTLGDKEHFNYVNFPAGDVIEEDADWIYEIPNPFPFRGATYICRSWAESKAADPRSIIMGERNSSSLALWLEEKDIEVNENIFESLPEPVLLTLAMASKDPFELTLLAKISCSFRFEEEKPVGLVYEETKKGVRAVIKNHDLFEAVVNNIHLPDVYKEAMVLRPGVQGASEITGEWNNNQSHIFEYLRRNSYIPWGHYAANMANDAIRYSISELTLNDMTGLRHLYFQRTIVRVAKELGIELPKGRQTAGEDELEHLREKILDELKEKRVRFNSTLWGWNFGFDYSGTGYRLHASHQQIHQQFAMVPSSVDAYVNGEKVERDLDSYSSGDLVHNFISEYRSSFGTSFFKDYIGSIRCNKRMDGRKNNNSLIIFEDENVILFVPKAQTSQWEIQLLLLDNIGNILETNSSVRKSINKAMLIALKVLTKAGAKMVSTIEFSKRFDVKASDQHLLYSFLPKLPESMGAFSEAQLRWINGHYPEDFALILREQI